jgi:acetyl esterase/lipase
VVTFLKEHPSLHLGGQEDFHEERRHHLEVFGFHALPKEKQAPIGKVEFTVVRGPHGTVPIRLLCPRQVVSKSRKEGAAALVYMHGGGYTVGSVDEVENGSRLLAEQSGVIV